MSSSTTEARQRARARFVQRIEARLKDGVTAPRSFADYTVSINDADLPGSVELMQKVGRERGYDNELKDHLVATADTCFGKPRIKDTRITVELVLSYLAAGKTEADIIRPIRISPRSKFVLPSRLPVVGLRVKPR